MKERTLNYHILKKCLITIPLVLLTLPVLRCQDSTNMIPYYIGFRFVKGVYRTYDEFRRNSPSILYNYQVVFTSTKDLKEIKKDYVKYYNPQKGKYEKLFEGDIWGFTDGKVVYKLYKNLFFKLGEIKPIMWISSNTETLEVHTLAFPRAYTKFESYSLIYDFENDTVYSPRNTVELEKLMKDKSTQDTISNSDTNKTVFMRIEEFDANHPVYFPVSSAPKYDDPFGLQ